jgi:hypothetical protein
LQPPVPDQPRVWILEHLPQRWPAVADIEGIEQALKVAADETTALPGPLRGVRASSRWRWSRAYLPLMARMHGI